MPGGGRRERGFLLGDPQGVEGIKAGIGTSVIREADDRCLWSEHPSGASRMSPLRYIINLMLKCVTLIYLDQKRVFRKI